jgi:hypothetical protein
MSDKVVTLKTRPKNSGKKLIELQKMKLSSICMECLVLTNRIISALNWSPQDVAFSSIWNLHYVVADRYVITFERINYYIDAPANPINGQGVGVMIADMDRDSDEDYDDWVIISANNSYFCIPDQETIEYIIEQINAGNVEIG